MNPAGPWLFLVGPLIFLGFAFFTRATVPRAFAALLGGPARAARRSPPRTARARAPAPR